ncbi:unnamed protein product [Triticum turgidum subsp. durum]|uniref:Uncharacterized protein n=1 Tax=Triticum turgidum subsp. durum TaxID=4567 RepID=A0A9R1BTQ5_TRITD|nr:unnamed protein product [Triticum turgidum subsp. durum]
MAEEQRVAAERRARRKLLFAVPIIPIVLLIVGSCALFLFTAELPRIRIEYACLDGARDAPATNSKEPPEAVVVQAVPGEEEEQPLRQLSDRPYSLGPNVSDYDARRAAWLAAHPRFPAFVAPGRPRVLMVTGSSPRQCKAAEGDHPCGEPGATYDAVACREGMERALNFADDQILGLYGFQHESLGTTAVRRVRNDTGRPLDADDEEVGRLLHPEFRAANPL